MMIAVFHSKFQFSFLFPKTEKKPTFFFVHRTTYTFQMTIMIFNGKMNEDDGGNREKKIICLLSLQTDWSFFS